LLAEHQTGVEQTREAKVTEMTKDEFNLKIRQDLRRKAGDENELKPTI